MSIPIRRRALVLSLLVASCVAMVFGCARTFEQDGDVPVPLVVTGRLSTAVRSDSLLQLRSAVDSGWRVWPSSPAGGGLARKGDPDSVLTWVARLDPIDLPDPHLVVGIMPHPARIWVNGIPVHVWSDPAGRGSKVDFRSHSFALRPGIWNRQGTNLVVMQIHPAGGAGRLPNLSLASGRAASLRVWRNDLLNYVLPALVLGTGLFLSALFLVLFFQLGRERWARVWFWATSVLFAISHLDMVLCAEGIPEMGIWKISRLSLCLAALVIGHFQLEQSGWSRLSRRILPWTAGVAAVVAIWLLSAGDHAVLESRFHLCTILILGPMLVANLALSTRNLLIRRGIAEAWTFLGLSIYAIGGTHDLVVYTTGVLPETWWYPAGFLFLDYCLALTVSHDLVVAWRQNRQRAADLEFALHGQQVAKARAEAAANARNRFLEEMAHRFRTPLQGLSGALELGPGELGPEVRVELGHRLGAHLAHINEVIDRIDLDAGRIEVKPVVFELSDLVETWNHGASAIGVPGPAFHLDSPVRLRADRERIERIGRILFSSVGSGPAGGWARIRVFVDPRGLVLEFAGTNSLQEALDREPERGDLGMALDLLKPLGASLDSVDDAGFSVAFPVEILPREDSSSHFDEDSRPLVVLAEDDRVNARILTSLLDRAGCRVVHALDGQQAVQAVEAHRPSLVLMDVMMPVMDGLEATRRIRGYESLRATPVIGVTAHANSADCLAAGMDEMLAKPVRAEQIREVVQRYCAPGR